ncbi:AAA family ATPase [Proteus terrae]|uniref:AAA family ATPase n=1 Tax=Proteus terrae TaxID=1574161 RepID=UPI003C2FF843
MQLRKIKWKDHPIIGDLSLDFVNSANNKPYSTILLAGENGTGKSTILETISSFLNYGKYEYFDLIEYSIDDVIYRTTSPVYSNFDAKNKTFFDIIDENNNITKIRHDRIYNTSEIDKEINDLRYYGCVYSKARSDYKTRSINSTMTTELDKNKHDIDQEEDFTSLKQLIVDVENQDYYSYSQINITQGDNPQSWNTFYPNSKLFRFKNAFNNFFEKLKYDKVVDINSEKTIIFSKNNHSIPIDKLSTGEKQIVFRGAFLLRNTSILDDAIIMIDEPELSMHPKWQRKILNYYKQLFSTFGQQTAQIIFATHSDHVLKEALSDNMNNIVITLEENNGVITSRNINMPSVLPMITTAETTYLAFGVLSNDYHTELYGFLQDKHNCRSVKHLDNFIINQTQYDITKHKCISNHGNTQYESLCTYIRNAIHHPDSGNTFTEAQLKDSINLLIKLCR